MCSPEHLWRYSVVAVWVYVLVLAIAFAEVLMGRHLCSFGEWRQLCLWEGESLHDGLASSSQCLWDRWSLTHLEHGLWFGTLLHLYRSRRAAGRKAEYCVDHFWRDFLVGLTLEALWEIVENTPAMVASFQDRNYLGDSVVNSLGDMVSCSAGLFVALSLRRAPLTLALIFSCELLAYLWMQNGVFITFYNTILYFVRA